MKTMFNYFNMILLVMYLFILSGCIQKSPTPEITSENMVELGNGTAQLYIETNSDGSPSVLGIKFKQGMLEGLPEEINNTSRCFDMNGDGKFTKHDGHSECLGDYERFLFIPENQVKSLDIPFQWVGLNWNPEGHPAPAPPPWLEPHFDFHFYIMDHEALQQVRPGICGEKIDCDDFKRATKPVPEKYIHENYINVNAAVPAMGNHLIDKTAPELSKTNPVKFTHTFIYGAYDSQITFYEPMITKEYLESQPDMCKSVYLPDAWEKSGYYPTEYCIRYLGNSGEYTVSLEKFVYRTAD